MNKEEKILLAKAIMFKEEQKRRQRLFANYHSFSEEYLWITDKKANKIKLKQNFVQKKLEKLMQDLVDQNKPPRIIILKSRQMGMSTDTEGRMVYSTVTKENRNGLVVAHRSDSTAALFAKTKYFVDNLEEDIKPLTKASNATELIFSEPTHYNGNKKGLNGKIKVQTAGNSGIGRSDTFHYVHLSEFAFWEGKDENAPCKQLSGIMQSVPDQLDTWVIIESTANGMNDFKTEWDKACKGESAFTPIFLAWYEHEEYIKSVNDKDYFIDTMEEYEKWLYYDLNLPIERVAWWRWAKKNKCNGDINQMKQENPTTPEEAFIFSGTPVFDNEKVQKRIAELEQSKNRYEDGYFDFEWNDPLHKDFIKKETIKWINSKTKPWIRIYSHPKKGYPYVIAGDTKGEGKDFYTGQVMDNTNAMRVATVEMQLNNSKPYTHQMYCLGIYYNVALMGIEMNFNTAPLEELERLSYPNQYFREKTENYYGEIQKSKLGWKTDGITRPRMIDKEVSLAEEHLELIQDIPTLKQMLTFVYDKDGRPDAMSGEHDDLLIADCILEEISRQQTSSIYLEEAFNIKDLPEDLQEDYYNAPASYRKQLLKKWGY